MGGGSAVTIIHERITEHGGSEQVVEALHRIWPSAPVCVPIADRSQIPPGLATAEIRTSSLQRLYRGGRAYTHLLPMLPAAMRSFDLSGARLVLVSHHAFANRIRPPAESVVVSYTHTPARWMWDTAMVDLETRSRAGRLALRRFADSQRSRDRSAAQRPDLLVVNSRHVAARVSRWWGRDDTVVVHPPIDTGFFTPDPTIEREDFFLLAGRMVPYKRPEIALDAAARARVRLVVAGDGRARKALEKAAGPTVDFVGAVDKGTLRDLMRRCRALVFPGEEDFGMVPVEAQACGTPVVAFGRGGVLDSVIDGQTGALYPPEADGVEALAHALASFDDGRFDPTVVRRHAEAFSPQAFAQGLLSAIGTVTDVGRMVTAPE